jgi:hypothetical protein
MNLIETDQLEGEGIIITPKDGNYENVVFWFHGLGQKILPHLFVTTHW